MNLDINITPDVVSEMIKQFKKHECRSINCTMCPLKQITNYNGEDMSICLVLSNLAEEMEG